MAVDDVPVLSWLGFYRRDQIDRRDIGVRQLERRRTDSDEQLEIDDAPGRVVVEAAGGGMTMAGAMSRQVRVYSVLPVMMTGGTTQMRVHERSAHGRGMDRRRNADRHQVPEHTALFVPIQGKSRRGDVTKPEEFLNPCSDPRAGGISMPE